MSATTQVTAGRLRELVEDTTGESVDQGVTIASTDFGFELNINAIAIKTALEDIHRSDWFSGIIYRPDGLDASAVIFESGEVYCFDAETQEDAETVIERVNTIVEDELMLGPDPEIRHYDVEETVDLPDALT